MTQAAQFEDINLLESKLQASSIPQDLKKKALVMVERLTRMASTQSYSQEYDSVARYLEWITSLPWEKSTKDNLSLENAKKVLDINHYGLEGIKQRILEFISVQNLRSQGKGSNAKAPALLLLGLVGTGKTTMAYSIAEALGRHVGRIPMGGMGDAIQLRGTPRASLDAEPGQIAKVLRRVGSKNPVILLDEVDRVTDEARSDIMGVLVELLDPEQHSSFLDHYIDYPFDLSEVLFIATANNTAKISTAVLDRLETLELPTYSDEQKIIIGKNFLLPRAITASGLNSSDLNIDDTVWPQIVRPLGFDAGMRTLDRTINGICRKVAMLKLEGEKQGVKLTAQNIKEYMPTW
jgi:ATP-dependent Lon protease